MIPTGSLHRAVESARAAGATRADVFHRCSRTRFLIKEPGGRLLQGTRAEEGMAVRAWADGGDAETYGFAAGTPGSDAEAEELGRCAAAAVPSGRRAQRVPGNRPPGGDGESHPGAGGVPPPVFDPGVLRVTPAELCRLLDRFEEACGAVRRPGLLWALGVDLSLAVVESRLLRSSGEVLSRRASLVSVQARFPSAFGLGRLEIVTRRLSDLDPSLFSRMLAPYPVRADRLARAEVRPVGDGDATLTLAPSLAAVLVVAVARQAAARGRPLCWESPAKLVDDPLLDWGPGSVPWDADGLPLAPRLLAGPAESMPSAAGESAATPLLPVIRPSVRERPVVAPTNLILSGVPSGAVPEAERRIHLLEAVTGSGDPLIARGVFRGPEGDERPVLARLRGPLEGLFRRELRGSSLRAFFAAGAFASAPELTLPGVEIEID